MNGFELNTTIANLRDLRPSDLSGYDAVYLGDIYCRLYESNFLEQLGDLKEGLHILRTRQEGLRGDLCRAAERLPAEGEEDAGGFGSCRSRRRRKSTTSAS